MLPYRVGILTSLSNVVFHWLAPSFMFLAMLPCCAKCNSLKGENVKKCIRMGISVLKIDIWGGNSLVSWSQNMLYVSTDTML